MCLCQSYGKTFLKAGWASSGALKFFKLGAQTKIPQSFTGSVYLGFFWKLSPSYLSYQDDYAYWAQGILGIIIPKSILQHWGEGASRLLNIKLMRKAGVQGFRGQRDEW